MLEVLMFAALCIAVAQIWSRIGRIERQLARLEAATPAFAVAGPVAGTGLGTVETWRQAEGQEPSLPEAPLSPFERQRSRAPNPLVFEPRAFAPPDLEQFPAALHASEPVDFAPASYSEPEPQPEPEPEPHSSGKPEWELPETGEDREPIGFEELFGRRLPIWAGGVTLAVAGVFIVRYSIEAGLLSPLVRILLGLGFGAGLIGAAEAALRNEHRVQDPRVWQALAGAGIASLYASILVAVNLYALIGPVAAFIGMAAVTALAMALSLRFGPPSALLGLAGGLAAPALVGAGQPDVPLLSLYLALAVGGLSALSRTQRWAWLGIAALAGGLGWGAILLLGGALDAASTLSVGVYILLVGIVFPLFALPAGRAATVRFAGGVAAAAQVAALVATGGFALLNWGLFGLISIAILLLVRRDESLRHLPLVSLAIALLLLGAWTDPAPGRFALVLLGTGAIHVGPIVARLWRPGSGVVDAAQVAGFALAASLLSAGHYYRADGSVDLALAAVALASAALPAVAAALGWRAADRRSDSRFSLLASGAAILVAVAAAFVAPLWLLPVLVGAIAASLLILSHTAGDERIEYGAWAFAALTLPMLAAAPAFAAECERALGLTEPVPLAQALLRWAGLSWVAAFFAWRGRIEVARTAAQAIAAFLVYGAVAQLAPSFILPLLASIALVGLAASARRLSPRALLAAMATMLFVIAGWAILPMLHWIGSALPALVGDPLLVGELPVARDVLLRLLAPAVLIVGALRVGLGRFAVEERRVALVVAAAMGAVALHAIFKQLIGIGSNPAFVQFGLAERTLWEALLAAAGVAAWKAGFRRVAVGLCAAGFVHFGVFTLLLHNPLWSEQAVGKLPLLNLLLPAYALPLGLLWAARRWEPNLSVHFQPPRGLLQMLLAVLLAFSMLRQAAEGSLLSLPGLSAEEDIARSILAILLAIGFLLKGLRTGARDWRIASLVLMLGAVAKVFLLDASGLEGLMRIASFVALGLSLIGIGWLYSRALRVRR